MSNLDPDGFMTPEDLANWLMIPIGSIYRWRLLGTGPKAYKIGRHLRYRVSDIDAWLAEKGDTP